MVDLNNNAPIDAERPENQRFLEKLQGNILRGHGRNHATYVFARFRADVDEPARRAGLRTLAPRVTSAWKQRQEEIEFRATGRPGAVFGNVFLSARAYRGLGYGDNDIREIAPEGQVRWTKSNFLEGMAKHRDELKDPPLDGWDQVFQEGVDLLVVLADDDENRLRLAVTQLIADLAPFASEEAIENGHALRNPTDDGYEHFGYLDGRSQPVFLAEHVAGDAPHNAWNAFEPLGLVLVKDGGVLDDDACGSFFVFRKLEQNVKGFVQQEQELAQALNLAPADVERAGAMVVGRFRDGTPLVTHAFPQAQVPELNDFRFDNVATARCPFHSHIRKANPRGDVTSRAGSEQRAFEREHRIVRRGIPYGASLVRPGARVDPATLPSEGVGLLFGCFQALIANQFAHIQAIWLNAASFPEADAGVDPLIAAHPPATAFDWPAEWDRAATMPAPFREFVTLRGGEFFFAPSKTFLDSIA